MNLFEIINLIKQQIYLRLPNGRIYERTIGRLTNNEKLEPNDINYYYYWQDLKSNLFLKYVLCRYLFSSKNIDSFFEWLDENYKEDKNHYSFIIDDKEVKLPIPDYSKREIYKAELFDMIFCYLLKHDLNWDKIPFHKGPCEYNKVYLEPHDTVLDIGANYGLFSAFASSKGCNVYAFEPLPIMIDRYLSLIAMLNQNIKVYPQAITNYVGSAKFKVDNIDYVSSFIFENKRERSGHQYNTITVETNTIDNFVEKENIKIDFIKADIEGSELMMLKGVTNVLKNHAPKLAICKYHNFNDTKNLTEIIKDTNPNYIVETNYKKLYAYVPKK